jgi:hypothetical protein
MSNDTQAPCLTDFLRYHALVRVFNGNISLWLHILRNTRREDSEDARFLKWLQQRCETEPTLLEQIRERVDASGLWPPEHAPRL